MRWCMIIDRLNEITLNLMFQHRVKTYQRRQKETLIRQSQDLATAFAIENQSRLLPVLMSKLFHIPKRV